MTSASVRVIFQDGKTNAESKVGCLVRAFERADAAIEMNPAVTEDPIDSKPQSTKLDRLASDIVVLFAPDAATEWHLTKRSQGDAVTLVVVTRAELDNIAAYYLPFKDSVHIAELAPMALDADAAAQIVRTLLTAVSARNEPNAIDDHEILPASIETAESYQNRISWDPEVQVMAEFLAELRSAIRPMKVAVPPLPWDPADAGDQARTRQSDGSWTLEQAKVTTEPIGLTDLFYANSHERARNAFSFYPWSGETKAALSRFGKPPHLLLTGDSGTGKTMIASFIRRVLQEDASHSKPGYYANFGSDDDTVPEMPFVVVNCAALTFENVVHLLHGSDPTAWSGGILVGDFVRGAYGVIFFDELGDLTYDVQRSLLMFLEDRVVRPHGMSPFPSFARIVAATNRDLTAMVRRGEFRHDLLARFARQVEVPSLARRGERDRQRLVLYAAANPSVNKNDAQTSSRPVSHISDAAMKRLGEYDYPDGNYRDLEATVHRAIESAMRRGSRVIGLEDVRLPGAEFTSERARLVVDLAPDAEVSGRSVAVARPEELERLAVATGRPMLREAATGSLYLPDGDIVYAWKGGRATGESGSAMGDTGDEGAGK